MRLNRTAQGILVIIGGVLVHLSLGTLYTYGNMTPYITSYFRSSRGSSKNLTYSQSVWVFSLSCVGQAAMVFVGGFIHRRLGTRLTTLMGGLLSSLGVTVSYFTIKSSFVPFVLTYGMVFGLGVGIAYAIPINCAMKWFPRKKGLVGGIVVGGFGGGAFIFNQIQTAYLNPRNDKPTVEFHGDKYFDQDDILSKVPEMFLLLGAMYAGLQVLGTLLIHDPPPVDEDQKPLAPHASETNSVSDDATEREAEEEAISVSPKLLFKRKAFYILWFIYFLNGQGIQLISTLYKSYALTFIDDDHFLALVGSLAAVCNGGGRPMWGYIADKSCFKVASVMSSGLFCALMLTLSATERAGKGLFLIYICLLFLMFSANFGLLPTATAKSFGQKNYPVNYGLVFTAGIVTTPLGVVLTDSLKPELGWYGLFFMISGFSFTCVLLSMLFNVKDRHGNDI